MFHFPFILTDIFCKSIVYFLFIFLITANSLLSIVGLSSDKKSGSVMMTAFV